MRSVAVACLLALFPVAASATTLKISGTFIFDAGIYAETYGADAGVTTGTFEFFYNPDLTTETLYSDGGAQQSSNWSGGILEAYIDFAGVRYTTSAVDSLGNIISVQEEYNRPFPNNRDRVNFVIGLGSE